MDKIKALYNKLNNGERVLTKEEAELIMLLIRDISLEKGGKFENRGRVTESLSLATDGCLSCGRPY